MFLILSMLRAWTTVITLLFSIFNVTLAYRPVQHCKHIGDNGHYSACTALTQSYNETSGYSDLYIRYHWYKYKESKNGWHAFALGVQMAGAHMMIMYGDPNAPYSQMTVSVRTADGHHPVRPVEEFDRFKDYFVPELEVVNSKFEEYTGPFFHEELQLKPTHVGVMEGIIRSYALWPGTSVDNSSDRQPMLWSSNYKQDFQGDYTVDRNVDMHAFGLGFGFLWVDMLNAVTPFPMFGPINETAGLKGVNEIQHPDPPTTDELAAGQAYIEMMLATNSASPTASGRLPLHTSPGIPGDVGAAADKELADAEPQDGAIPDPINAGDGSNVKDPIQQPARTILGKSLRDWMWHLHGILMIFAFVILYPLGVYLLRRPPQSANGNGFNSHWTIQSLATVTMFIGALIGYVNSYGISVTHQYIGIFMIFAVSTQILLGWRHHVIYMATKRKTLFSKIHIYTGRFILPLGFVNIVLGMQLRRYGWLTISLLAILMIVETLFLAFVLRTSRNARTDAAGARTEAVAMRDDEAEEYFQLGGEDDEFSDSDAEGDGSASHKQEQKRKQAERLSKLDRV